MKKVLCVLLLGFIFCENSFAGFFLNKFENEDPKVLSEIFINNLEKYKEVEYFNNLNEISEEDKSILNNILSNMWKIDQDGSSILNMSLYLRDSSKKNCDKSIKTFLQNMASHSLALAAIKKNSYALGLVGKCSRKSMEALISRYIDLSALSLEKVTQDNDYKYLTSLIKSRWTIEKKK